MDGLVSCVSSMFLLIPWKKNQYYNFILIICMDDFHWKATLFSAQYAIFNIFSSEWQFHTTIISLCYLKIIFTQTCNKHDKSGSFTWICSFHLNKNTYFPLFWYVKNSISVDVLGAICAVVAGWSTIKANDYVLLFHTTHAADFGPWSLGGIVGLP